jgi:hypothetical protein
MLFGHNLPKYPVHPKKMQKYAGQISENVEAPKNLPSRMPGT